MKMSTASALQIQWFLNVLVDNCMASAYLASDNHPKKWQFAVEAIYCLKSCNLVDFDFDVLHKSDQNPDSTYNNLNDFCYHLSMIHPDDWESGIWIDAQLLLTPKGRLLVENYFCDFQDWDHKINQGFVEKLESIFERNQVPWNEDRPRFPVRK